MSEMLKGFVWEKVVGEEGLLSSNCTHTNSRNISKNETADKFYIPMLQTSNLAVLLIFSCSFHFWYSQSARY